MGEGHVGTCALSTAHAQQILAGAAAFPGAVGVQLPSAADPVLTVHASLVGLQGQPASNDSLLVQVRAPHVKVIWVPPSEGTVHGPCVPVWTVWGWTQGSELSEGHVKDRDLTS